MNNGSRQRLLSREGWVILTVLLLFLTGLPAIFVWPAETILFNPISYQQALESDHAYDSFPLLIGQMIAEGGDVFLFGSGSQLLQLLQKSNYEAVIRQVFPQEWVRAQANSLIDQFWAYFNFHSPQLQLIVDMRAVKQRLSGDSGAQIAASIIQDLPACSQEDVLKFFQQMLSGTLDQLPLCRPPEQVQAPASLLVEGMLKGSAAAMPDQLDMAALLHLPAAIGGRQVSQAWTVGFAIYHFLRMAGPWLPWIALLLLILTGVLARGAYRGPLYWLGFGLLLPGLAALISAFVLGLGVSQLVPLLIGQIFGPNLVVFRLFENILTRVITRFTTISALVGFAVLLVGLVLLAASYLLRRGRE